MNLVLSAHREMNQMTSESPSNLGVLHIRATPISRLIKVVTFTQSWQMRREGVVPSHDVSCSRMRPALHASYSPGWQGAGWPTPEEVSR